MLTESTDLPALSCPSCGNSFRLISGTGRQGVASCSCRELVIVDGVILPVGQPAASRIRDRLEKHPDRRPLRLVLPKSWLRVRFMELTGIRVTFRRYLRHALLGRLLSNQRAGEFFRRHGENKLIKPFWSAGQWHLYMRHRFTSPSFLAARAALGLLEGRDGLVLDAPSGMGHFSHYLTKLVEPGRLVAVDLDPESAYATRRFFVPTAAAVMNWDLNEPLPLPGRSVGTIFCVDAFHYVRDKQALAAEFMRVLRDDGVLAILHLHNRLQYNPMAGSPLAPGEYAELFSGYPVRSYPEDDFLAAYSDGEAIDLTSSASSDDLAQANALMVVVAKDPAELITLSATRDLLAQGAANACLAELYTSHQHGQQAIFERQVPPTLRGEYPNIDDVLPERWPAAMSTPGAPAGDQFQLLRHNVFIDLPGDF